MAQIRLGEPVIVSQGPEHPLRWGPWQFPEIERMACGRLHVTFHRHTDSILSYGQVKGHAISDDDGTTWREVSTFADTGGLRLRSGDRLRSVQLTAVDQAGFTLPEPIGEVISYGNRRTFYRQGDFPPELTGWSFARLPEGTSVWQTEHAQVETVNELRFIGEGRIPRQWFWTMRLAPDGSLWGVHYEYREHTEQSHICSCAVFYRSADNGHSWQQIGTIPYTGDPAADTLWRDREGFSEPDVSFLPDGTIFCLLRTTDSNGLGPLYESRSTDGGRTWSKPVVFDTIGVWPRLLTLGNGVTLASYGRTGLFVRGTTDPAAEVWGDKIAVVPPGPYQQDTCSYSDMIALDDHTALLVYSDFNVPDAAGVKRKTILVRKVYTT
ncbi:sialidase family protein [Paenibacillus cymbidii]|uniref:sialidase family protein n=1 Tax=Paenibacillus cymbidii TaxID=1639034 RepID=UPI001081796F|nr:sialidase family protein [Paenibacillus cymbidii]